MESLIEELRSLMGMMWISQQITNIVTLIFVVVIFKRTQSTEDS